MHVQLSLLGTWAAMFDDVSAPFLEDYPAAPVTVNPWSSSQDSTTVFYHKSRVLFFLSHLILASAFCLRR